MKAKEYERAVKRHNNSIELGICKNPCSRKFYSYVNKKLKSHSSIPSLRKADNTLATTDLEKAELLNLSFQNFFTEDDGKRPHSSPKDTCIMQSFELTEEDVVRAIKKSKDKVSRTPEDIPIYFIKRTISSIIKPLHFIFYRSIKENKIPDQWKTSIITPVFKKGSRCAPGNYRPIALTSSFSRILEAIVLEKITSHLLINNLLTPRQFGFLAERSSCSQLLTCLSDWWNAFSASEVSNVVYTDITKAFDSVSHSKLLKVLEDFKITSSVIDWIRNFLKNRNQRVVVNSTVSSSRKVFSGVPQGSVIGPLLFVIYINDITKCTSSLEGVGNVALFADDMKVYSTKTENLQVSLNHICTWLRERQLTLAPHKCTVIPIKKPSLETDVQDFYLNTTQVSHCDNVKDLGVIISSDLKWSSHVNYIHKSASATSYQIFKAFKTTNIWTLLKLFTTYVRPKLEFNTSVWSPYLSKDIEKIEKIQATYTRKAFQRCNIKFSSYENRLYQLSIKSLQDRRIIFDLVLTYKIIHGLTDMDFNDFFTFKSNPYSLRGNTIKIAAKLKINTKNPNLQIKHCFFLRATKYWNLLPDTIAQTSTLNIFKHRIAELDFTPFYYFLPHC